MNVHLRHTRDLFALASSNPSKATASGPHGKLATENTSNGRCNKRRKASPASPRNYDALRVPLMITIFTCHAFTSWWHSIELNQRLRLAFAADTRSDSFRRCAKKPG